MEKSTAAFHVELNYEVTNQVFKIFKRATVVLAGQQIRAFYLRNDVRKGKRKFIEIQKLELIFFPRS